MNPELIGRYRIVKQVGRGGFATVFLGEDQGLDDLVAIKVLSADLAQDHTAVTRFVAEARLMRNQRAPGVVTVHDVGEFDDRPYFVMEYCPRGTLSERLESLGRTLTLEEARGLAAALGTAVGDLHQATPPVVHRDLKPGNLLIRHRPNRKGQKVGELLQADEELIVGDFGLAKVTDPGDTKFTLVAYSRGFAPPEQLRGDASIGPSADVYSASAVLTAAMSGAEPTQVFADGERAFDAAAMATTGPLRAELERGLSFRRDQRHQTIVEWAEAIAGPLSDASQAPAPSGQWDPPTRVVAPMPQTLPPEPPSRPPSTPSGPVPGTGPQWPAPVTDPSSVAPAAANPVSAPPIGTGPVGPGSVFEPPVNNLSSAPPPGVGASTPQAGSSRRRLPAILAAVGLGVVLLIGGVVIFATGGGPTVVGPQQSLLQEEVAFAIADEGVTVQEWRVGGDSFSGQVLRFAPTAPGQVNIEAITDDGNQQVSLEVEDGRAELLIGDSPVLPLNETTVVSVRDEDGAVLTVEQQMLTWTVGGENYSLSTLELLPAEPGTITVTVSTADGREASRTFTVPAEGE